MSQRLMKPVPALTSDPIPQLLWRMAVPSSVGMFFTTMYNFVDTYCAGLLSTDALAALSLSFPVFFLLIAVGSGCMQGTTALMAHALGEGNQDEARRVLAQSIILALAAGAALSVAGWFVTPWLFRQLGAEGRYLDAAVSYMHVIYAGGIFFLLPMTLNAALLAQGETRIYRNFLIVGFVANCVLNPVFMWGWLGFPSLGVAGIALATVMIQVGGCVWLWWRVMRRELFQKLPWQHFQPNTVFLRRIVGQSFPAALNMLTIALGVFVITGFVQQFGKNAVAASGIAMRIEQLVLMPVIGLCSAVLSIAGQNHGAGLPQRVREVWSTCLRYGVFLMWGGGLLVWLGRSWAMQVFTQDAEIIRIGSNYLFVAAVTLAAYPILFGTVFLMQGLRRPAYGLWIGLYRQVLAPLAIMSLFVYGAGWGLWGVWWGICLVNWSAALFALWWGWRTLRTLGDPQTRLQRPA
jgi:putative MATE family efflux protein